jgi:hypothetical protein
MKRPETPKHPFSPLPLPSCTHSNENGYIKVHLNSHRRMTDFDVFSYLQSHLAGAIFREDQKDNHYDLAFKFAVHKINKDQHILPKTTLIYDIQYVKADDSFHANKQGDLLFNLFSSPPLRHPDSPFSSSLSRYRCLSISETVFLSVLMLVALSFFMSFRLDSLLAI